MGYGKLVHNGPHHEPWQAAWPHGTIQELLAAVAAGDAQTLWCRLPFPTMRYATYSK